MFADLRRREAHPFVDVGVLQWLSSYSPLRARGAEGVGRQARGLQPAIGQQHAHQVAAGRGAADVDALAAQAQGRAWRASQATAARTWRTISPMRTAGARV
jgi:hypothetical protein